MDYPSPQDLIDYLSQPGIKKNKGQMANDWERDERCCLGHYAHLAKIPFRSNDLVFCSDALTDQGPTLSPDHWLFSSAEKPGEDIPGWYQLQHILAEYNDVTDDFGKVIELLKEYMENAAVS